MSSRPKRHNCVRARNLNNGAPPRNSSLALSSGALAPAAKPSFSPAEYLALLHPPDSRGVAFLSGPTRRAPLVEDDWTSEDPGFVFAHTKVDPAAIAEAGETFIRTNGGNKRYVTMNRFSGWPCEAKVLELNCAYVDLDYYKTALSSWTPAQVLYLCLTRCDDELIPPPSLATFSGRGLLLVWLHNPAPAAALPRWKAMQERLHQVFHGLGVDNSGKTCTKVFRIPGSVNRENVVRVIYPRTPAEVVRWDFEDLARELLPGTRSQARREQQSREQPKARGKAPAKAAAATTQIAEPATPTKKEQGRYRFEGFWRGVEAEVHSLRRLRYSDGKVREGQRDLFCFVLAVAAARLLPESELLPRVEQICRTVAGWDRRQARSVASSVLGRAQRSARGEQDEWMGKLIDPRYRMKGSTIARFLDVQPEEVERLGLVLVVPEEIKQKRRREAVRECRKRKGVVNREERRARREAQAAEISRMRDEGGVFADIAAALGISVGAAHAISREFPNKRTK